MSTPDIRYLTAVVKDERYYSLRQFRSIISSRGFLFSPTGTICSVVLAMDDSGRLQQSLEAFGSSSEILGSLRVIFEIFEDPRAIVGETLPSRNKHCQYMYLSKPITIH